jgi:hypothetical protein
MAWFALYASHRNELHDIALDNATRACNEKMRESPNWMTDKAAWHADALCWDKATADTKYLYHVVRVDAATEATAGIIAAWLLVWIIVKTFRWVRRGFTENGPATKEK